MQHAKLFTLIDKKDELSKLYKWKKQRILYEQLIKGYIHNKFEWSDWKMRSQM